MKLLRSSELHKNLYCFANQPLWIQQCFSIMQQNSIVHHDSHLCLWKIYHVFEWIHDLFIFFLRFHFFFVFSLNAFSWSDHTSSGNAVVKIFYYLYDTVGLTTVYVWMRKSNLLIKDHHFKSLAMLSLIWY